MDGQCARQQLHFWQLWSRDLSPKWGNGKDYLVPGNFSIGIGELWVHVRVVGNPVTKQGCSF